MDNIYNDRFSSVDETLVINDKRVIDDVILYSQIKNEKLDKSKATTEVRFSKSLSGAIKGSIRLNDENTPYSGTIIVRDIFTNDILIESNITDGEFSLDGFNPELEYIVECYPSEDKYLSKLVTNFRPNSYISKNVECIQIDESSNKSINYSSTYRIKNIEGELSINLMVISGLTDHSIIRISNNIFKVIGTVNSSNVKYDVIISDNRGDRTSLYTYNREFDFSFNFTKIEVGIDGLYDSNGLLNFVKIGNPEISTINDGQWALISGIDNCYQVAQNDLLTLDDSGYEISIKFMIDRGTFGIQEYIPILSTETAASNNENNIAVGIHNRHLRIKCNRLGEADANDTTLKIGYHFLDNVEYEVKIIKNYKTMIIVNDRVIYESYNSILDGKIINLSLGGNFYIGAEKGRNSSVLFKFNNLYINKGLRNDHYSFRNIVDEIDKIIYFNDKVIDSEGYEYNIENFNFSNDIKTNKSNRLLLMNVDGYSNVYTTEFKFKIIDDAKQYILYSENFKIFYENNKIIIHLDDNVFEQNIIDPFEFNTVTFSRCLDEAKIILNGQSFNYNLDKKYNYINLMEACLLSDYSSSYNTILDYILFDKNAYDINIGRILKIDSDKDFDMVQNETIKINFFNLNINNTITTRIVSGNLPSGTELIGNQIFGAPNDTGVSRYILEFNDEFGSSCKKEIITRVGYVATYLNFDNGHNATSLTDLTGNIWSRTNNSVLNGVYRKFGISSGAFNGSNQNWNTPYKKEFIFQNEDFTISAWVYNTSPNSSRHRSFASVRNTWSAWNASWTLMRYSSNNYVFEGWNGPRSFSHSNGVAILNRWEFITISKKDGYLYFGKDGNVAKFEHNFYIYDLNRFLAIGNSGENSATSQPFGGYIDEFKIVYGAALYNKNFDVSEIKQSDFPSNIIKSSPKNIDLNYIKDHLKITWEHHEYCSYSIYISESTMVGDGIVKPDPIAINIESFEHEIYDLEAKKYYIIISSNKNGVEIFSDEQTIDLDYISKSFNIKKTNPFIWYDMYDYKSVITDYNGLVERLKDKSKNEFDCINADDRTRPVYEFSRKSIYTLYSDTTKVLSTTINKHGSYDLFPDYTIFIVAKPYKTSASIPAQTGTGDSFLTNSTQHSTICSNGTTNDQSSGHVAPIIGLTTNGFFATEQRYGYAPYLISRSHSIGNNIGLFSITRDSNNKIFRSGINGVYIDGIYSNLTCSISRLSLFSSYNTSVSSQDLNEMITFNRLLSTEEIQIVEGYLSHKWNLTSSLPEDHPYKIEAPIRYNPEIEAEYIDGKIKVTILDMDPIYEYDLYISNTPLDINNLQDPYIIGLTDDIIEYVPLEGTNILNICVVEKILGYELVSSVKNIRITSANLEISWNEHQQGIEINW